MFLYLLTNSLKHHWQLVTIIKSRRSSPAYPISKLFSLLFDFSFSFVFFFFTLLGFIFVLLIVYHLSFAFRNSISFFFFIISDWNWIALHFMHLECGYMFFFILVFNYPNYCLLITDSLLVSINELAADGPNF